jgi:hypothetical protein
MVRFRENMFLKLWFKWFRNQSNYHNAYGRGYR